MTTTATAEDPEPVDANSLLTIDQAADYLAITKATLYTCRSRRIGYGPPAVKVGGCLRFRRTDLDDWITAHTEGPEQVERGVDSLRGKAPHPSVGIPLTRKISARRS